MNQKEATMTIVPKEDRNYIGIQMENRIKRSEKIKVR